MAYAFRHSKPSYPESVLHQMMLKIWGENEAMDMCLKWKVQKHLVVDMHGVLGHLVLGQSIPRNGAKTPI